MPIGLTTTNRGSLNDRTLGRPEGRSKAAFTQGPPKAEMHCHIEGTLEPEMVFDLAEPNEIRLRYPSVEALRSAYEFNDLQSFLDVYSEAASVLITEQAFHDLIVAHLERARADGVIRAGIFFDPKTRAIPFEAAGG